MPLYPGFGLPLGQLVLPFHPDVYPTLLQGGGPATNSPLIQVREVAMMHIMDRLTDEVDWHKKVFDKNIVAQWREEALAYPNEVLWKLATDVLSHDDLDTPPTRGIMSEKAFDYCIDELRAKARYFAHTGIVPTLDAVATVAKSDNLIQPVLASALRKAFRRLKKDQAGSPNWQQGTGKKVLNLVHPSMYPLVFGTTKWFQDEVVGVLDAVDKWAGKGKIYNLQPDPDISDPRAWLNLDWYSENYQWLPSNVALHNDGSVKFTSYINNLHPTKYPEIYAALEKLVEKALPMWDQCLYPWSSHYLGKRPGRNTPRFSRPTEPGDDNPENWFPRCWTELPVRSHQAVPGETIRNEEQSVSNSIGSRGSYDDNETQEELEERWLKERQPVLHEPESFEEVNYVPPLRLLDRFRDTGLQIIVKMASIELTPKKPYYNAGSWHLEGQTNEHICGTALYYLDSENITTSHLSFRMATDQDLDEEEEYRVKRGRHSWLEKAFGTNFGNTHMGTCLQQYGNVKTPQGRIIAYPNVLWYYTSPFRLVDPTKPGHLRFIVLWLVDPHIRIISTANVPPQQQDWWLESVLGRSAESQQAALAKFPAEIVKLLVEKGVIRKEQLLHTKLTLPTELMDMVRSYFGDAPGMSVEEARDHRLKLTDERTISLETLWTSSTISVITLLITRQAKCWVNDGFSVAAHLDIL
ncbi:hypothetical protein F4678DRAFT_426585 [Xylaria arbuscula]|nr:hypothetical protein F4678DRAFT_426585 [Xylaria arbuscula]